MLDYLILLHGARVALPCGGWPEEEHAEEEHGAEEHRPNKIAYDVML